MEKICKVNGCKKSAYWKNGGKKGWCSMHYRRWFRYGNVNTIKYASKGSGCIYEGYKIITVNGKKIFEHRYIMEQHIGRKLKRSEIIHHINEKTTDNRIENLMIDSQSNHASYHGKKRYKHLMIPCDSCGKIFKSSSCQRKRNKYNYCSNECAHFEKRIGGKSYTSHCNKN